MHMEKLADDLTDNGRLSKQINLSISGDNYGN